MKLYMFNDDTFGLTLVCRHCANEREAEGEQQLDTAEGVQCQDCGAEERDLPVLRRPGAFGPGAPR